MNSYSFIDLLSKEIEFEEKKYRFDGIQIPIIQRDYAHGRDGKEEIRRRFLLSIFNALEKGTDLELDFIYGSQKTLDKRQFFIPLDGQQRLTTLFLLYWYIGNRELYDAVLEALRTKLKKFTYATRNTSDTFCEKLSDISLAFVKKPSDEIKNSAWFHSSYLYDPTIKSMLVMLDAIHVKYGLQKKDLYPNLQRIKFYVLPLDGFDLTDELYIKMNARGKQLTQYENFKADLIKWMKDDNNVNKEIFQKQTSFNGREVKYHEYFELKLDTDWTNLFWTVSKESSKHELKLVDPHILRFWNRFILNEYIVDYDLTNDSIEFDPIFLDLYGDEGNDLEIKYSSFSTYENLLKKINCIPRFERVLNGLTIHFSEVNQIIKPGWDRNDKWNLFSDRITQRQRILQFAITKYFILNDYNSLHFKQWIRVVWNFIIDPDIRSVSKMVSAMKYINQISHKSDDINKFLKNPDSILFESNSNYYYQLEEERWKATLIDLGPDWERAIIEAEAHRLFQGNIRFMLKYGESEYLSEQQDLTIFQKRKEASFEIFKNNSLQDKPSDYLWVRALLAKSPDIELPIKLSNGRFNDWRSLINKTLIKGMRILIDDILSRINNVEARLEEICVEYQMDNSKKWVYPIIKWTGSGGETLLGNYSETRWIREYDYYGSAPMHIYLYNQTRWTEGNIILSNNRNLIIAELLRSSNGIKHDNEWKNIQNTFFRGWNIVLTRTIRGFIFSYEFDKDFVKVGIKSTPELEQQLQNTQFDSIMTENGWICRVIFDYKNIKEDEIIPFIYKIENEVFTVANPNSIVSIIDKRLVLYSNEQKVN